MAGSVLFNQENVRKLGYADHSYVLFFLSSRISSNKVTLSTLLSALELSTVPSSSVGATLHHWDSASVNWDGSVVKSWWCNILAENSVSVSQPEKLDGRAVACSLHSPRSLVVNSLENSAQLQLLL